jgi:hypothetical protein
VGRLSIDLIRVSIFTPRRVLKFQLPWQSKSLTVADGTHIDPGHREHTDS